MHLSFLHAVCISNQSNHPCINLAAWSEIRLKTILKYYYTTAQLFLFYKATCFDLLNGHLQDF